MIVFVKTTQANSILYLWHHTSLAVRDVDLSLAFYCTAFNFSVVLDERGVAITSEEFAGWLESSMNQGCKRIVFAIGGPFGHAAELRKKAWKSLAFSPMVLNHEMARMLLAEQLYRASTIIWGGKYHH